MSVHQKPSWDLRYIYIYIWATMFMEVTLKIHLVKIWWETFAWEWCFFVLKSHMISFTVFHAVYTVHIQWMATESASVQNNMLMGEILLCALMLVYWSRFNWESSFGREQHVSRYRHHHDDDTFSIQRQCHRLFGSVWPEYFKQPFNLRTFLAAVGKIFQTTLENW